MAKKKMFNTKNFTKKIGPALGQSAAGTGGFLLGKIAGDKITEKYPKMAKAQGPVKVLLGAAIIAATDEKSASAKYIQAAAMGMSISGGEDTINAFVPEDTRAKMGLRGIASTGEQKNSEDVFEDIAKQAAEEVERELQNLNGYDDDDDPEDAPNEDYKKTPPQTSENVSGIAGDTDKEFDEMLDNLMD